MITKVIVNGAATSTEVLKSSHRKTLKTVLKMINRNCFVNDGEISHRLVSIRHPRSNATFLKVCLAQRDIITIAIVTNPSVF